MAGLKTFTVGFWTNSRGTSEDFWL